MFRHDPFARKAPSGIAGSRPKTTGHLRTGAAGSPAFVGTLLLALCLACGTAAGQETAWDQEIYNPLPAEGDLILPTPCGGAMVFRPVDVPGEGVFDDQKLTLGGRDPQRAFVEHARPVYLSGTFRAKGAWRYYLGKYEVSVAQFEAINGACPDVSDIEVALPHTGITMAEAVLAAERYTEWLFRNAPDQLPTENGAPGYARLPTEAEWEYAARGGVNVGPADFEARMPPMSGPPEQYIVFCQVDCAPELIGSRDPNPLGLHDMLGNVGELVHGLFHLSRVGRAHGSAGAYVKRGGDFRKKLPELHSGLREEFSPLGQSDLRREPSTGFRIALVAPVLPDRERLEEARDTWDELAENETVSLGEERADPREEVRTLADFAGRIETDQMEELNRRLLALADVIEITIATRNEERARAAREMLRVGVIAGLRLPRHQAGLDRCGELLEINPERYQGRCDQMRADSDYDQDFYLDHLTRMASEFPPALIEEQTAVLEREFESRRQKALVALPVVVSNLEMVRRHGTARRDALFKSWAEFDAKK